MTTRTIVGCALGIAVLFGARHAVVAGEPRSIYIIVTEDGFEPTPITVNKGETVTLVVTRKTEKTCAKQIVIDEDKVKKDLPLDKPVKVTFTPKKAGELKYGCAMGKMMAGVIKVVEPAPTP